MKSNSVSQMGGPSTPRRLGVCMVILSVLALLAPPIGLQAQGKGGGKPGGGGGGGDDPSPPPPGGEYLYTLTRIDPPEGTDSIHVHGMNNQNQLVGSSYISGGRRDDYGPAFRWNSGLMQLLPALGNDPVAQANAVADNGLIVGTSFGSVGSPPLAHFLYDPLAVWWYDNGSSFQMGTWNSVFPDEFFDQHGIELEFAEAVSRDGTFVVLHSREGPDKHSLVAQIVFDGQGPPSVVQWWVMEAYIQDISHDGSGNAFAVGYPAPNYFDESGLYVKPAESDEFVFYPLVGSDDFRPSVRGVNAVGETVATHSGAVFFGADLIMQHMGTLGGTRSVANSINDQSYAVGWSTIDAKDEIRHAFLWHPESGMLNLNDVTDRGGLVLTDTGTPGALINNVGQIVSRAVEKKSSVRVLLTPIAQD